jgi:hypothetical protein
VPEAGVVHIVAPLLVDQRDLDRNGLHNLAQPAGGNLSKIDLRA